MFLSFNFEKDGFGYCFLSMLMFVLMTILLTGNDFQVARGRNQSVRILETEWEAKIIIVPNLSG